MTELESLKAIITGNTIQSIGELGEPFVAAPGDWKLHDAGRFLEEPTRIKRSTKLLTLEDFGKYVKDYGFEDSTRIYADSERMIFVAILDDHLRTAPSWCTHTACYECPLSREWKAWKANDNKRMSQIEFAEFLEDRAQDVEEPAGADLYEMAVKFRVIRKSVFGSATRLSTGELSFEYSNENQKGTIELPESISIGIPIFHHGAGYRLRARLKYRLADSELTLWYSLVEPDRSVEDAFNENLEQVREFGPVVYEASTDSIR